MIRVKLSELPRCLPSLHRVLSAISPLSVAHTGRAPPNTPEISVTNTLRLQVYCHETQVLVDVSRLPLRRRGLRVLSGRLLLAGQIDCKPACRKLVASIIVCRSNRHWFVARFYTSNIIYECLVLSYELVVFLYIGWFQDAIDFEEKNTSVGFSSFFHSEPTYRLSVMILRVFLLCCHKNIQLQLLWVVNLRWDVLFLDRSWAILIEPACRWLTKLLTHRWKFYLWKTVPCFFVSFFVRLINPSIHEPFRTSAT